MNLYHEFKSQGFDVVKRERLKNFDSMALGHLNQLIELIEMGGT